MAFLIKATGERFHVSPDNGTKFTLKEIHSMIGGYMECHNMRDGQIFVCNEDGPTLNLPPNPVASAIFIFACPHVRFNTVVGNVLICTRLEMDGDK